MSTSALTVGERIGRVRFSIVAMLFAITVIKYADRATISSAGPLLSRDLGITPIERGFVL